MIHAERPRWQYDLAACTLSILSIHVQPIARFVRRLTFRVWMGNDFDCWIATVVWYDRNALADSEQEKVT